MSALTFITSANIVNYNNVEEIQTIIVKTLATWIYVIPKEMYNGDYLRHWTQIEGANAYKLIFDFLEFNLHFVIGLSEFHLEMYAIGNYRRHGSSCDYFERIFDCLFIQLKHPDREFKKMDECLSVCTKSTGCYIGDTHKICKLNNLDSYNKLNNYFLEKSI